MNILSVMTSVISGVFLIMLIREVKSEYAVIASVLLGLMILVQILPEVSGILNLTNNLIGSEIDRSCVTLLYKAVGTSMLCGYVSDTCRECGMESIASKTELFGKIYLTSLSLPLIENIFQMINEF